MSDSINYSELTDNCQQVLLAVRFFKDVQLMCFSIQVDQNIKKLSRRFNAQVLDNKERDFERFRKDHSKIFDKLPDANARIYPNFFCPVLTSNGDKNYFSPMRYQLLPHFNKTEKYTRTNPKTGRQVGISTFNARLDSLEKRHAWKNIFMKKHALVAFNSFYEYVRDENDKPMLVRFSPNNTDLMWAACLWDHWECDEYYIDSFAIITNTPPPEVLHAGHDRCPIFIKEQYINEWLRPENESKDEIYELLLETEPTYFNCERVD